MTQILNTLFVVADKASVHKDHDSVVVRVDREEKLRIPLLHLQAIVCLTPAWLSPELMLAMVERGGHIAYLDAKGHMLARLEGVPGGSVPLRRAQFRAADDPALSQRIARSFVVGKVVNQRHVLQHAARDSDGARKDSLSHAADRLAIHLRQLEGEHTLDELRGLEGIAARDYFAAFGSLIRRDEAELVFGGRTRRPPLDRINALLSFAYALLLQDCIAGACSVGLDPAVGYLHEDRPGRMGLALDLMEELRAPVADRFVLASVNLRRIQVQDVEQSDAEGFRLTKEGRKKFLAGWQEARKEVIQHSFLDSPVPWGQVPHVQALLLARMLRGDVDEYPPFVIR